MDTDLDTLAGALRERLLAAAGEGEEEPAGERIRALVDREAGVLDAGAREGLAARIAERAFGLGPLEPLLADPEVEEIMVSGTRPVWVERGGRLERTEIAFAREADLREAIERILAPLGRRVDEAEPLADARLPDRCAGTGQSTANRPDRDPPRQIPALTRRCGASDRRLHPCFTRGRSGRRELHQS